MRFTVFVAVLASVAGVLAAPLIEVSNVVCDNSSGALVFHDVNVAQLQICGSIAGTIQKCEGNPTSTTGASGTAKFSITPATAGATINVSKGRWEQSIKLAFAKCGQDVPFSATFKAGASTGDINVTLVRN